MTPISVRNATLVQVKASPSQLRGVFGANLRKLSLSAPSIAALCRELDINRTQYNRYLAGESFPRPDVLARICAFFEVDARILLEHVEDIDRNRAIDRAIQHMQDFVGLHTLEIDENTFPSGFYRFSRRSFLHPTNFVVGLVYVYRLERRVFVRGFEPMIAMQIQGLPHTARAREYRGQFLAQDGGLASLMSRRGSLTASFSFLSRVPSFENNFWLGYTVRTIGENSSGQRAQRMVYEHLGRGTAVGLRAQRATGLVPEEGLHAYHRVLLKPDQSFS